MISAPNFSACARISCHQLRAHDAVAMPGKILDERRQHQLTAGFEPFDDERLQVGARRVQSGREAGRAGPDDGDVAKLIHVGIRIENVRI